MFARCRGEALGAVSAPAGSVDLEITDVAPTYALTVDVVGLPDDLVPQIRLVPREIPGSTCGGCARRSTARGRARSSR